MPARRPFGVTLLLWLVLSLSAWGAIRLLGTLRWWSVLSEFGARLSPLFLSITGTIWVLVGLALLWGLFTGKPWSRLGIPVAIFLWAMEYWAERLFFQSPRANIPFALIATVLLFVLTYISAANQKTKRFFIKSEEHEQPNEYSDSA